MVCTANDLLGWKDFPKGLRVLILDDDTSYAAEMRSKLKEMDYVVSTFHSENEALAAISDISTSFHVAIVEVKTTNSDGRFKFLESTRDLPTIMTSDVDCLSTMMHCIALGAVEFLKKPLSEDKLRNIWQHVAHKAFNAGGKVQSESTKPEKQEPGTQEPSEGLTVEILHDTQLGECEEELSAGNEKCPAPSTPQIKQGVRLLDDGDCQDHTNSSTEKESTEQDGESKSVETTCGNLIVESTEGTNTSSRLEEGIIKQEQESTNVCKDDSNVASQCPNKDDHVIGGREPSEASGHPNIRGTKSNRRKGKIDWTPNLHKKFVQAVEKLGVDQAIPSRILELMKTEGLTRHNVASHLQKYRIQRRHILPKENDRRWPHHGNSMQRNCLPQRPVVAYPPFSYNHMLPGSQVYPAWYPPYNYRPQTWCPPYYPAYQPTESWHWNPYPGMNADAWGCPMTSPPIGARPSIPQGGDTMQSAYTIPKDSFSLHPAEELVDKVVKEAISKPWLPLPLGLKPPSTESVVSELSKQGISTIPPRTNTTHHRWHVAN